jgi:hypothetical protein
MKYIWSLLIVLLFTAATPVAFAGAMQRIGHTTLVPRHSNPDDKGMYAAAIDPANGYAYFIGSYLFKLDMTGDLPVQVGPAINTGQIIQSVIDPAAGYLYLPRTTVNRYAVGTGTNAMTNAGSFTLTAGAASEMLIDDSDPAPANHYGYVLCTVSGNPARVAKVALSTFTELGYVSLNTGESNFLFGACVDAHKGYAYFVTASGYVVKIKMTPGTNLPVRIGAVALDVTNVAIDGGSIDTVHGYAYYGTYDSDTNVPGKVYKVKLEEGDVAPSLVGKINLHAGEGRLSASVLDPVNGFVYFANDNTYPGNICQLSLNGTNLPVEIQYMPLQGGPQTPPPNGVTTNNTTTNLDGVLPFGEVFFRSGVFDPVRGFAYFGQDSRPNQVVKVQLAQIDPVTLTASQPLPGGAFQFSFTNIPGAAFSALASTNLSLPISNWLVIGDVSEVLSGQFQFTDSSPAIGAQFYRVRSR